MLSSCQLKGECTERVQVPPWDNPVNIGALITMTHAGKIEVGSLGYIFYFHQIYNLLLSFSRYENPCWSSYSSWCVATREWPNKGTHTLKTIAVKCTAFIFPILTREYLLFWWKCIAELVYIQATIKRAIRTHPHVSQHSARHHKLGLSLIPR